MLEYIKYNMMLKTNNKKSKNMKNEKISYLEKLDY